MSPALRASTPLEPGMPLRADLPWNAGIAAEDMLTSSPSAAVIAVLAALWPGPSASNDPAIAKRHDPVNPLSVSTPGLTARSVPASEPAGDPTAAARAERDTALAALMRAAAAGNARAFEDFYDATISYAQALARRIVSAGDLQDVLADAYFQAWREAPRFDATRGSAVTWLLTLVRSRALDLLRHLRASPEVELAPDSPEPATPQPGPEELLASVQAGTRLQAALAELSRNERWVLGLAGSGPSGASSTSGEARRWRNRSSARLRTTVNSQVTALPRVASNRGASRQAWK